MGIISPPLYLSPLKYEAYFALRTQLKPINWLNCNYFSNKTTQQKGIQFKTQNPKSKLQSFCYKRNSVSLLTRFEFGYLKLRGGLVPSAWERLHFNKPSQLGPSFAIFDFVVGFWRRRIYWRDFGATRRYWNFGEEGIYRDPSRRVYYIFKLNININ